MSSTQAEILLVDENKNDAELTVRALRRENLSSNVAVARNGEEALDYLFCRGAHANRSFDHPPRLVLLDLDLPKVDGIEVLRQIKDDPRTRTIPVVILTSSHEEQDVVNGYSVGANSYVHKPADVDHYRQTLKSVGEYWLHTNRRPLVNGARRALLKEAR